MKLDTILAMAAGAALYHVYSELRSIKEAINGGQVISLSSLLDMADDDEHTEEGKFGFVADKHNKSR